MPIPPPPPPSTYTEAVGLAITARIAAGEALTRVCKTKGMPPVITVYGWLRRHPEFAAMMAQARLDQADSLADDLLAVANDPDIPSDQKKVMVDARKWIASHFNGVKYGDRQTVEHQGGVTVLLPEKGDDKL